MTTIANIVAGVMLASIITTGAVIVAVMIYTAAKIFKSPRR